MFGYVTIYHKGLAKPELDRYQAYYCGLCRTLGQKYGLPGQLTLSYDLAFIAILHSALYEPETQFSAGRCAPHPIKARPRAANEFLDYAADMTIALAYYNFLDNWQDDHSRASLRQAKKLEGYLPAIREHWPRQTAAITAQLDALNALEKAGSHDLDALCRAFGDLLGTVFACREDIWSPTLQAMGRGLGGFIYLMDAYDDLPKDARKGQFNALQELHDTACGASMRRSVSTERGSRNDRSVQRFGHHPRCRRRDHQKSLPPEMQAVSSRPAPQRPNRRGAF